MRLIDADKIHWEYKCISKEEIDDEPTVKAIPIEWIINWLTKQTIPALHTCDDYDAVNMMLDDWENENER